jgi:4-amino-4-deoxy-L-arabinose transferase-like glycosyltransferase
VPARGADCREPDRAPPSGSRILAALESPALLIVLYAALVLLWFKDEIHGLRGLKIGWAWAFIPLAALLVLRTRRNFRGRKIILPKKLSQKAAIVLILLSLTLVVRLPFVLNGAGLMNSDDSIAALMGKHISEGRMPPICFYGQQYMGSFPSHVYALFFKVFGYSIFVLKLATLLAYLGFIALIFLLFADLFEVAPAAVMTAFFILPIGHLVLISLDNSSGFGFVLFFEAAILWGARRAVATGSARVLPPLGFVMGLAFWTNQAAATVILTAVLYLVWKLRRRWTALFTLAGFAALGALPLVYQEISNRFQIFYFLFGGEKGGLFREKLAETAKLFQSLLSPDGRIPLWAIGLLMLAGFAALAVRAIRSKGKDPVSLIVLFTVLFVGLYFSSRFSDKLLIRYLYPSYIVYPVLLSAGLLALPVKRKLRIALISVLIAGLFIWDNAGPAGRYLETARKGERIFRHVVETMVRTGRRYWSASYWVAYHLTAIAGERVIVDSYTNNRFPAYRLGYTNNQNGENFVFIGEGDTTDAACAYNLDNLLKAFSIPYRKDSGPEWSIFYGIPVQISPATLWEEPPSRMPQVGIRDAREENGLLRLDFASSGSQASSDFRIKAEFPGYSSVSTPLPPAAASASVLLPIPEAGAVPLRYSLEYLGFPIRSSEAELVWRPTGPISPRKDGCLFLSGFSEPMRIGDRDVRICGKTAALEATLGEGRAGKLRLVLESPLQFADLNWHGRYEQSVRIRIEGRAPYERLLADGLNTVDIDLGGASPGRRSVRVDLEFRYHFRFDLITYYLAAAFLEKAEILE